MDGGEASHSLIAKHQAATIGRPLRHRGETNIHPPQSAPVRLRHPNAWPNAFDGRWLRLQLSGKRTVVDLGPGESFSLVLLGEQRKGLTFEPLTGSVSVATTWQVPLDVSAIKPEPELTLIRTVLPSGDIPSTAFVEVRLTATFGSQLVTGCYVVTDLVPSGMAPVERLQVPAGDDPARFKTPWEIEAQRVSFCVGPTASKEPTASTRSVEMRYFARIVSPGEYIWEPAVIQSAAAAESINLTSVRRITVR